MDIDLRGFQNIGNTCYMNSALQNLFSIKKLNNAIIDRVRENRDSVRNMNDVTIEYLKILLTLLDDSQKSQPIAPRAFKTILGSKNKKFAGFSQEDAHELMIYVVNELMDPKADKQLADAIERTICGKYQQTMKCTECGFVKVDNFKFVDLELPISIEKDPSISDCIDKFCEEELLAGTNKWECDKCKKKVDAYKKIDLAYPPDVLVLVLNRFRGVNKINVHVDINNKLNITGNHYRLISVVNHFGSVYGGHYTSTITRNGTWFKADDSRITQLNNGFVSDQSVYIAIYEKI